MYMHEIAKEYINLENNRKEKYFMTFVNIKKHFNRFGPKLVLNLTSNSRYPDGMEPA